MKLDITNYFWLKDLRHFHIQIIHSCPGCWKADRLTCISWINRCKFIERIEVFIYCEEAVISVQLGMSIDGRINADAEYIKTILHKYQIINRKEETC